jgi:hypothetical protein
MKGVILFLIYFMILFSACVQVQKKEKDEKKIDLKEKFSKLIKGVWVSENMEISINAKGDTSYRKRAFEFKEKEWSILIDIFDDKDGKIKLFSLEFIGEYNISDPSVIVEGAVNAQFGHSDWFITPRNQEFTDLFTKAGCGNGEWKVGTRQSVGERGCIGIKSVFDCRSEYDIVTITKENKLIFGERGVEPPCSPDKRLSRLSSTDHFIRSGKSYTVIKQEWDK